MLAYVLRVMLALSTLLAGAILGAAALGRAAARPQLLPFVLGWNGRQDIHLLDVERALLVNWSKGRWPRPLNPVLSADGRNLVWAVAAANRSALMLQDLYAGQPRPLDQGAPHVVSQWQPTWSPDGEQVAFVAFGGGDVPRRIMVQKPEEAQAISVSHGLTPAWSPDGRYLMLGAFTPSGTMDLMTLDMTCAPTCTRQLFKEIPGSDVWPSWSPDGRQVAFLGTGNEYSATLIGIFVAQTDCLRTGRAECPRQPVRQVWLPRGWLPLNAPVRWSAEGARLLFLTLTPQARAVANATWYAHVAASVALYAQRVDCAGPAPDCVPQPLFTFDQWLPVGA